MPPCLWLLSDAHEKYAFLLLPFFLGTMENASEELGICHCPTCGLWTGDIVEGLPGFSLIDEIWVSIKQWVVGPQSLGLWVGHPNHRSQGFFIRMGWASLIWGHTDNEQPHFTHTSILEVLVFSTSYVWIWELGQLTYSCWNPFLYKFLGKSIEEK